jgi:hypothetical protein
VEYAELKLISFIESVPLHAETNKSFLNVIAADLNSQKTVFEIDYLPPSFFIAVDISCLFLAH